MKNLGTLLLIFLFGLSPDSVASFKAGGFSTSVSSNPPAWKSQSVTPNFRSFAGKRPAFRHGVTAASNKSGEGNSKNRELSLQWNLRRMRNLRLPGLRVQWRRALASFVVAASVWMQGIPRVAHAVTVNTRFAPGSSPLLIPVTFASLPAPPVSTASKGVMTVLTNGKVLTAILVIVVAAAVAVARKKD